MYHQSQRSQAGTSKDSEVTINQDGTAEGTLTMLEHERVYWEHPRHARKRPRLGEDEGQIDTTPLLLTPVTNASTSEERCAEDVPTPPSFALRMDTTMREASEMSAEVKKLKREIEMLKNALRENIRSTSEDSRRLEARLERLERSSQHIAKACQSAPCQPHKQASVTLQSLRHMEDNARPSANKLMTLLHDSDTVMGNLDIPVQDPALRSKVAKLLGEIYDIIRADVLALATPVKCERHINDDRSTEANTAPSKADFVEPSDLSSSANSCSISQSPDPPSSSRHTTPLMELVSPNPKAPMARIIQTNVVPKPLTTKRLPLRPVFIHPPFTAFPNSNLYPQGLSYDLMVANPEWFLDHTDFISTSSKIKDAIPYPPELGPTTHGMTSGNDRPLRCTFCRKTYTGEDAEIMWRNHVIEQHGVVLDHNHRPNDGIQLPSTTNKITSRNSQVSLSTVGSTVAGPVQLGPPSRLSSAASQRPVIWHMYSPPLPSAERTNMPHLPKH